MSAKSILPLDREFEASPKFTDQTAICPHCGAIAGFPDMGQRPIRGPLFPGAEPDTYETQVHISACRGCRGLVIGAVGHTPTRRVARLLWPTAIPPDKAPGDLDSEIRRDYDEARMTLNASARASAVLSRRCLQHLLRTKMGITLETLHSEIGVALKDDRLSANTRNVLHDVRELGNLGAHPEYDKATSLIDVDKDEAEFLLEAVEMVFQDLYVAPGRVAAVKTKIKPKLDAKKEAKATPKKS